MEEMHTWAVRPKQHCIRGGEGPTLFRFDESVAWREIEKYMEMSQQFCSGRVVACEQAL